MKEKLIIIIGFLVLIAITGIDIYQKRQYKKKVNALTSMNPQQVTIFKIYPRVIRPIGTPITFKAPDPLIKDFFQSLTDLKTYWPSGGKKVVSRNHSWFLEVSAGDVMIQISFHIPAQKGDIVAGQLGKFGNGGTVFYGSFQSRELFQWYQTYSHRWLTEEEDKKIRK